MLAEQVHQGCSIVQQCQFVPQVMNINDNVKYGSLNKNNRYVYNHWHPHVWTQLNFT